MPITTLDGGPRTTVLTAQSQFDKTLAHLQQELFDLGAECSTTPDSIPEGMQVLTDESCERLVTEMNEWLEEVKPLSSFILPSGNPVVANIHLARAVTRRCERRLADQARNFLPSFHSNRLRLKPNKLVQTIKTKLPNNYNNCG